MRYIFLVLGIFYTFESLADVTGAGDAAILSELVAQTKMLADELKKIESTLNIQKNIERMEELKTVRKTYEEGKAFKEILTNLNESNQSIQRMRDTKFGSDGIVRDARWLDRAVSEADSADDYSDIAIQLRELRFLGKANRESAKKISQGTNQEDNEQICSSNSTIIANLKIKEEERRMQVQMAEEDIFQALFLGRE